MNLQNNLKMYRKLYMLVMRILWIFKIIRNVKKTIHVGNANCMNLQNNRNENVMTSINVGHADSMNL